TAPLDVGVGNDQNKNSSRGEYAALYFRFVCSRCPVSTLHGAPELLASCVAFHASRRVLVVLWRARATSAIMGTAGAADGDRCHSDSFLLEVSFYVGHACYLGMVRRHPLAGNWS